MPLAFAALHSPLALSGIAAEGLENGSGIASRTIASTEHGWAQGHGLLTARDVLVIDEAGIRTDDGRSVSFDTKHYAHVDHGYAATIHKAQGMTVDKAHVLATPGMDHHGSYVSLSRHRDGVQLHYGRDDFKDESRLVRTLSRERTKDMASDYERRDPAQQFAERRGITFREHVAEIVRKIVPERARGMFDRFRPKAQAPERGQGLFANFRPQPHEPERGQEQARAGQARAPDPRRAVERYARAAADIERMQGQGLPVLPHQREALDKAREGVGAIRPHAAADLASAIQRQPGLVHEAAGGRTQAAMQAMQLEAEIRSDPFQRADRFVEGWQQLQQHRNELQRDGDLRGVRKVSEQMGGMARGLERDAQMESILRGRTRELGIDLGVGRSLSRDLANSVAFDHGRNLGMSR